MANVLIVDDTAFIRLSLRTILESNGFEIAGEAENGEAAIEKYFECKPDIVTMDISMPKLSGTEALKRIKQQDPSAKVVMISATSQKALVRDAIIHGAVSFILKPFHADYLITVLKQIASM